MLAICYLRLRKQRKQRKQHKQHIDWYILSWQGSVHGTPIQHIPFPFRLTHHFDIDILPYKGKSHSWMRPPEMVRTDCETIT